MICIGFAECGKTVEQMHQTGINLRDCMMEKLCDDYSPQNITHTKKGKPLYQNIGFSVSHSHGAAACAVNIGREKKHITENWLTLSGGENSAVGVDIEPIDRNVDVKSLSKRFLSQKECEYVGLDNTRFLEIWTKKESACKLTGEGVTAIGLFCSLDTNSNICIETKRVFVGNRKYIMSVAYYKTLD